MRELTLQGVGLSGLAEKDDTLEDYFKKNHGEARALLNVVRVEFSKLRRWKLLRVLPLLSLVLPAITFSYFATHLII